MRRSSRRGGPGNLGAEADVDAFIAAGSIDGDRLKTAGLSSVAVATVADGSLIGGIALVLPLNEADAASGNSDYVLTYKTEIYAVKLVKTGGAGAAGNEVQLINGTGANVITEAKSLNVAENAASWFTTITTVNAVIAAGGTLRLQRAKAGGNNAFKLFVHIIRRA